jgi:hypothetical protein
MASKLSLALFGAAALAASAALGTSASAALCPASESFFGTIQRVNGSTITVQTPTRHWAKVRILPNARVNMNGNAIRPGVYVGAYGCVAPGGVFQASEITLSANGSNYREQLSGVVRRIGSDRILVAQDGRGNGWWYVPNAAAFSVGQRLNAVGMIGANGGFYPQSIDGRIVAYDTTYAAAPRSTITLSGTVRRVNGNTLVVWEPAYRTTGTWVVGNAARFRVGQRVSGVGTEDRRGRFYVQQITIL